jgi:hypothetical protein
MSSHLVTGLYKICVCTFAQLGVGPSHFSVRDRHLLPAHRFRTLAKCTICKSLQSPKRHAKNLPLIVQAVPCTSEMREGGFAQDVCLQ